MNLTSWNLGGPIVARSGYKIIKKSFDLIKQRQVLLHGHIYSLKTGITCMYIDTGVDV